MQRRTRQMQAITDAFAKADRPLGPHDVLSEARGVVSSLGIATVYRAIRELVETGRLVGVATPAGTLFELAAKDHHHHFFCQSCKRTYDIPGCTAGIARLVPEGFVAASHELTITGRCGTCASSADLGVT